MFCMGCYRGDQILPNGLHLVGSSENVRCDAIEEEIQKQKPARFVAAYRHTSPAKDRIKTESESFPDFNFYPIEIIAGTMPLYLIFRTCKKDACCFV